MNNFKNDSKHESPAEFFNVKETGNDSELNRHGWDSRFLNFQILKIASILFFLGKKYERIWQRGIWLEGIWR